jgi:hypothetical protein
MEKSSTVDAYTNLTWLSLEKKISLHHCPYSKSRATSNPWTMLITLKIECIISTGYFLLK